MQRRWKITLAGAGTAVAAAGLSAMLVLPQSGGRPVAQGRIVPVMHLAHLPVMPVRAAVAAQLVSPFTGEPVKALGRVLVVKIDNIVDARPPENLTSADIVYLLPVEGGLSRIFAVYSSRIPKVIGPVRSAREDDLALLRQFGRPGFAYSGATPHLLPFIARARVVNLYDTPAYFRDGNRVAPHNLYAYGRVLRAEARGASTARDIGFRFGPAPPGGRPTTSFSVSYPAATFTFRWWARTHRWLVWMDGTAGHRRRRRAPRRGHRGHPGHDRAEVPVPGIRRPSPVRPVHRLRHSRGAPRRTRLAGALVPAQPGQRHNLHPALRHPHDLRARPGMGRPHHDELGDGRTLDTLRPR